jgi:hypothetical protein
MTSLYPTGLDNFINPNPTDFLIVNSHFPHSIHHALLNEAVSGLQRKVGIDFSTNTGSSDYRLRKLESGNNTKYDLSGAAYSAVYIVDFNGKPIQTVGLAGDIQFVSANRAANGGPAKIVSVKVSGDSVNRAVSFSGMCILGVPPTGLLANKTAIASFTSYGPNPSDTVVGWAAEA